MISENDMLRFITVLLRRDNVKEIILTGSEWQAFRFIDKLRKLKLLPLYPWGKLTIEDETFLHFDQAFGGEWRIVSQKCIFHWDYWPSLTRNPISSIALTMRGEIPLDPVGNPHEEAIRAKRNWFVETLSVNMRESGEEKILEITEIEKLSNAQLRKKVLQN